MMAADGAIIDSQVRILGAPNHHSPGVHLVFSDNLPGADQAQSSDRSPGGFLLEGLVDAGSRCIGGGRWRRAFGRRARVCGHRARGQRRQLPVARRRFNVLRQYLVATGGRGDMHTRIAQGVDQARCAVRITVDDLETSRSENLAALRARDRQPMHDVALSLIWRQRGEVIAQACALCELRQLRHIQMFIEFGQSDQNDT